VSDIRISREEAQLNQLERSFKTHSSHLEHAFWQQPHSEAQHERQQLPHEVAS
jgi:hypothetical protein